VPIGYVSFATALIAWALLALAIVSGGLDPGAALGPLLKLATATAFCAAVLAFGSGIAALLRARQRIAAALGLALSLLFLLLFTGVGFALFR
jgi:hypothetical protein